MLVLDHCTLRDDGAVSIVRGLGRCQTLTHLSIANCGFGCGGATAVSALLAPGADAVTAATRPRLQSLNISGNHIGAPGIEQLCTGVRSAVALHTLGLRDVGLDCTLESVKAMGELTSALVASQELQHVDLSCNPIGAPSPT